MLKFIFFFFNDTATTEIYTLSLHDALPIWRHDEREAEDGAPDDGPRRVEDGLDVLHAVGEERRADGHEEQRERGGDRKSTRLNSSHANISYAVFCLKKKK